MPVHSRTFAPVRWHVRLAAAAAAVTASVSLLSALLLSFDRAGPQTWLAPSAEVLEMAADCDRHTERSVRDHCKQQLVAVRVARDKRGALLAGP